MVNDNFELIFKREDPIYTENKAIWDRNAQAYSGLKARNSIARGNAPGNYFTYKIRAESL